MSLQRSGLVIWLFTTLILVGFGCQRPAVSTLSEDEAALILSLASGSEIVLRPTVFGLGGTIARWFGSSTDDRVIHLQQWSPGESVVLDWSVTSQAETAASQEARTAYDTQYAQVPIGVEVPEPPVSEYEDVVESGQIGSSVLAEASELMMPDLWPEGDTGTKEDTSLIWISRAQYDALVNTRKTQISLGLFDETISEAEKTTEEVKGFFDQIISYLPGLLTRNSQETLDPNETLDVLSVEAEGDWGSYTLSVDGVRTRVRTIQASNKFASYTILANQDNPLILEIKLTPLAQGNLEVLNPTNIAKGFSGYEITQINNPSTN